MSSETEVFSGSLFKDMSKRTNDAVRAILTMKAKHPSDDRYTTIELYTALGLIKNTDVHVFFWQYAYNIVSSPLHEFALAAYMHSRTCLGHIVKAATNILSSPRDHTHGTVLLNVAQRLLLDTEPFCRDVDWRGAISAWKAIAKFICSPLDVSGLTLQPLLVLAACVADDALDIPVQPALLWKALCAAIFRPRDDISVAHNLDMLFNACMRRRAEPIFSAIGLAFIVEFQGCGLESAERHFLQLARLWDVDPNWLGGKNLAEKVYASSDILGWLRNIPKRSIIHSDTETDDETD